MNLDAVVEPNFHSYVHDSLSNLDNSTNIEVFLNVIFFYYSVTFPVLDSYTLLSIMFSNIFNAHLFLKIRDCTQTQFFFIIKNKLVISKTDI
jgi:hypothetical protein